MEQIVTHKKLGLTNLQTQVDEWIKSVGVRYFDEMTNLANLMEEVGEVARLMSRTHGEQSFKKGKEPNDIKAEIADELSDVLFIVTCLANQMGIDLEFAMNKNLDKKTGRDKERHINNHKLTNESN